MAAIMILVCIVVILAPHHGFNGHRDRHPAAQPPAATQGDEQQRL